jgi:hypothetical protein
MDLCPYLCSRLLELTSGCSFPIEALKNVEWLRPRMRQYQSTTNNMSKAIREIGFESAKSLAAKGALWEVLKKYYPSAWQDG